MALLDKVSGELNIYIGGYVSSAEQRRAKHTCFARKEKSNGHNHRHWRNLEF